MKQNQLPKQKERKKKVGEKIEKKPKKVITNIEKTEEKSDYMTNNCP